MKLNKLLLLVIFFILSSGCTSFPHPPPFCAVYRLPPALTNEQREAIKESPFSEIVVGFNVSDPFEDKLIDLFELTNLFKEVDYVHSLSESPDLIVEVQSAWRHSDRTVNEGTIMFSIVTLGIYPVIFNYDRTCLFVLSNPSKSMRKEMEYEYIDTSCLGSLITIINLLPNWSYNPPQESMYVDLLSYELISNKDDILKLVESDEIKETF